jgi:DNA-binding response OmpR family regulator
MNASLTALGFKVRDAVSGEAGKQILETFKPDILIVEFDFPNGLNTSLIEDFRSLVNPQGGSVIVTTMQRLTERWRNRNDPINVLFKPFDMRLLFRMLKHNIEQEIQQGKGDKVSKGINKHGHQ